MHGWPPGNALCSGVRVGAVHRILRKTPEEPPGPCSTARNLQRAQRAVGILGIWKANAGPQWQAYDTAQNCQLLAGVVADRRKESWQHIKCFLGVYRA